MLTMGLKNHLKCHLKVHQHNVRTQSVRQHNLRQQKLRQQNERQPQKILVKSVTANKPYPIIKCPKCPAILQNSGALTMHTRKYHATESATDPKPFIKCPKCPTILPSIDDLTKHIKARHDYSEHICQVCGYDYKTAPRLKVVALILFSIECNFLILMFYFISRLAGTHGEAHRRVFVQLQLLSKGIQIQLRSLPALQGGPSKRMECRA